MIDRGSAVPLHRQLAALLAAEIRDGALRPGEVLASEESLGRQYGLGRTAVRSALQLLRERRLVTTRVGFGTLVRVPPKRRVVLVDPDDEIIVRAPTIEEEEELHLDDLEQVVEVTSADGSIHRYGADHVRVRVRR